jgi:hypothetical protein
MSSCHPYRRNGRNRSSRGANEPQLLEHHSTQEPRENEVFDFFSLNKSYDN